jgi:hypothetical protein
MHCYTAPNGDGLIPAPLAPMEVTLQEEVVSRIEVVITVRIVMVRTASPSTAIDHLRTRWGRCQKLKFLHEFYVRMRARSALRDNISELNNYSIGNDRGIHGQQRRTCFRVRKLMVHVWG